MAKNDLWDALTTLPRPYRVIPFPRLDPVTKEPIGEIAIWVLNQHEQSTAAADADRMAKKLTKETQRKEEANLGYDDIYNNEATVQVLYRACRNASNVPESLSEPAFPDISELRKMLSVTEIGALMSAYIEVQAEMGPIVAHMTVEEMNALLDAIARDGEHRHPLHLYSPAMKNELLRYSALRFQALLTDKSSPGGQPDAPETSE